MAPIFFDYERTPLALKKVHIALNNFETYLTRLGKKYAAANNLTIADFPLVTATMCLEAIAFDFSSYKLVLIHFKNSFNNIEKHKTSHYESQIMINFTGIKMVQHV